MLRLIRATYSVFTVRLAPIYAAIPNWTFDKLKGARFRPSFVRFDLFCALADEVWVSRASLGGGLGTYLAVWEMGRVWMLIMPPYGGLVQLVTQPLFVPWREALLLPAVC